MRVVPAADDERPEPVGIAQSVQPSLMDDEQVEGALEEAEHLDEGFVKCRLTGAGDQVENQLCVGGSLKDRARVEELSAQRLGVGYVAVVNQREAALVALDGDRLGVFDPVAALGRVTDVPDADARRVGLADVAGEDVRHHADIAVGDQLPVPLVADSAALLPAVLQCEQQVEEFLRDVDRACGVHAGDSAEMLDLAQQLFPCCIYHPRPSVVKVHGWTGPLAQARVARLGWRAKDGKAPGQAGALGPARCPGARSAVGGARVNVL